MRRADLSLVVRQRKLPCVLDPSLVLCHAHGPKLAQRLAHVMEPWLTRSFWQAIDASDLVLSSQAEGPSPAAVHEWIALRDNTDAGSWSLRWICDNFAQSQIQDSAETDVVERYETLAESWMLRQTRPASWRWDAVHAAGDALALSGTLDGALILSAIPEGQTEPWPVQALKRSGISLCKLDPLPHESLFATERSLVRDALASAGLAVLAQHLPPLAVVHVVVPSSVSIKPKPLVMAGVDDDLLESDEGEMAVPDLWGEATAWWYGV